MLAWLLEAGENSDDFKVDFGGLNEKIIKCILGILLGIVRGFQSIKLVILVKICESWIKGLTRVIRIKLSKIRKVSVVTRIERHGEGCKGF